jgi:hypothetical protein
VSFQGKYRVQTALGDGETKSFRGLENSSGRPVLIHHVVPDRTPPNQPDLASLILKFLRTATSKESENFLDMGEEEGRLFVVTADVPECLDLRKWLQSAGGWLTGEKRDHPASPEAATGSEDLGFTQAYTTEVLRQLARCLANPSETAPAQSPPPQPAPPSREKGPGILIPAPEIPAPTVNATLSGSQGFAGFWDKSSRSDPSGHPASISAPPSPPGGAGDPSIFSEATQGLPLRQGSPPVGHNDPTLAIEDIRVITRPREIAPSAATGPAPAKGAPGQGADLVISPGEVVIKPAERPPGKKEEALDLSLKPSPPPGAVGPETKTSREFLEFFGLKDKGPAQPLAPELPPPPGEKLEEMTKPVEVENVPRAQPPSRFEVVFQSNKPRSRPTLSRPPDQSEIMKAPEAIPPLAGSAEVTQALSAKELANVGRPIPSPPVEGFGRSPQVGPAPLPAEPPGQVAGAGKPTPPTPPRPPGLQAPGEAGQATRLVPPAPGPPRTPAPPLALESTSLLGSPSPASAAGRGSEPYSSLFEEGVPAGDSARVTQEPKLNAAPIVTPPIRSQPGEYTRMMENVRAAGGPLADVPPPASPPAAYRPAGKIATPPDVPVQATYLSLAAPKPGAYQEAPTQFSPSPYVANAPPLHTVRKKRNIWVPVFIFSGLFLMALAMLLFFAIKR